MNINTSWISINDAGTNINLTISTKSSKNGIMGIHLDTLKINVTAPPIDGKANMAVIKILSKVLRVPKKNLHITSGKACRKKTVLVEQKTKDEVLDKLRSSGIEV